MYLSHFPDQQAAASPFVLTPVTVWNNIYNYMNHKVALYSSWWKWSGTSVLLWKLYSSAAVCSAARTDDREVVCHSDDSHVPTEACYSADSRVPLDYRVRTGRWGETQLYFLFHRIVGNVSVLKVKSFRQLRTFNSEFYLLRKSKRVLFLISLCLFCCL